MGTDIHPVVEVRVDGKWERWARATARLDSNRNYWSFAVLADVRNGHGFAGHYTGEPVVPIASPRGIPKDSPETHEWLGDHSWSYVTLTELLALNMDSPVGTAEGAKPLREIAPLLVQWIEDLRYLPSKHDGITPDDVRVVFGFDS